MTAPEHDPSKLRINRDPPPEVRRAFGRTLIIVGIAIAILAGAFLYMRCRSAPVVQTVVATPISTGGGSASVTVDGGLQVKKGQVIARLENEDYAAAVGEARANLTTAGAQLTEAARQRGDARRVSPIYSFDPGTRACRV